MVGAGKDIAGAGGCSAGSPGKDGSDNIRFNSASISSSCWRVGKLLVGVDIYGPFPGSLTGRPTGINCLV
jgi:hypothetical protein